MQIMTKLKYLDKVCDEINGYLLWGNPELIVNYLLQNDVGFVRHTNNFLSRFQHFCHACSMGFENGRGWKQHLNGRKHQINQFKTIIMKYDRSDLVKDKPEVLVTSKPLCDVAGNVFTKVEIKKDLVIPFYIKINDENYCSYTINPLYDNRLFEFNGSAAKEKDLLRHDLKFKASDAFGHHFYPIFFKFDNFKTYKSIYILRMINLDVIGEMYTKLQVKEEYKKKELLNKPKIIETIPGIKLVDVKNCLLNLKEIDFNLFPIPTHLYDLFGSNCTDVELRKLLNYNKEGVNITNYINYFKVLLFSEEFQLDKDIRYYDMKSALFTDSTHDKFLHLNVPSVIENRPAVIAGDSLYVYINATHKKRFEGIVHEIINGCTLKIGISEQISYIQNTKYDIEFNYDKSAFKLMHAALDKCSKNLSAYKHLLFPDSTNSIKTEEKTVKMWFDKDLNDQQKKAVINIISGFDLYICYLCILLNIFL